VYAKKGTDLNLHLDKIKGYNAASVGATSWKESVYEGDDYLKKMLAERKGKCGCLGWEQSTKTDYILQSIQAGLKCVC